MKFAVVGATLAASLLMLPAATHAQKQTRFAIDAKTTLAWWQIDPNYGHLWATTCPDDRAWQPGEARSEGIGNINVKTRKKTLPSASSSRDREVPIYPRGEVAAVCRPAVRGNISTRDTLTWADTRGEIRIRPDSLVTGNSMRDRYARKAVFETNKFPDVVFVIDSLTNVQPGDTIRATAFGTLEIRGVRTATSAPVKAWRDKAGLRVLSQLQFPADDLIAVYDFPKLALGMGVTLGRWKTVYFGIDAILQPVAGD